jgi:hypothetical protein
MLERPPRRPPSASPGARRARASRARRQKGLVSLRVVTHKKWLIAALRAAGSRLPDGPVTVEEIEAAAGGVLADFTDRWVGKKKPCA